MKKTLRRKILPLFVGAIFICAFASSAGAIPLTYTDVDKGIEYTLNITDDANTDGIHTATFSIDVGDSSDLRIGWVAFGFNPEGETTVGPVTDDPDETGQWFAGNDKKVKLPWGGKGKGSGKIRPFKEEGWAGFYSEEIASSKSKGKSGGLELVANTAYTFKFTINDPDMLFTEGMPFRVGFYAGPSGKKNKGVITSNSEEELKSVPEPGTLLLVGSGLLLVGLLGRRKFKKVR